jgi:hypothetical protein
MASHAPAHSAKKPNTMANDASNSGTPSRTTNVVTPSNTATVVARKPANAHA